jgi:presenilin-like A22 family membrane protease
MFSIGETSLDAVSRTQTEIKLVYVGILGAWFCFIFIIVNMNRPTRSVSLWVLVSVVFWAVLTVFAGFVMRKKFFRLAAELRSRDLHKALYCWKMVHFIGFCCATNLAILGFVLKFLGSGWILAGIFFGLGLAFLVLWKPGQLAIGTGQPG